MSQNPVKIIFTITETEVGGNIEDPYNTAGWTSVEITGKIIEKIGPILAINGNDFYNNHVAKNLISNLKTEVSIKN